MIQGQDNRAAEPASPDFIVMTPIRRRRLATNVDVVADVVYVGSIAGAVLTVSSVSLGTILVGAPVFGVGVAPNTVIASLGTGAGGTGTYNVSPAPQTVASGQLASGQATVTEEVEVNVQLDVHGPASAENAQAISTLLRDEYGVNAFLAIDSRVTPLHADDAAQRPFINDQNQFEQRWVVEALLQADESVLVPQDAAGSLTVTVKSIDATFPA